MAGGRIEMRGQRFGKLIALEPTAERKNGYTMWRCQCDCGGEVLVASRALKNGWTTHCGCELPKIRYQNLTGKRFGRLTVISIAGRNPMGKITWNCVCDCGGKATATSAQLLARYKKSCGCLGHPPLKDWVGKRFGTLEVISYAGKRGGSHYWHCVCHCGCGRELDVSQSALQNGHTKSCGSQNWNVLHDWVGKRFGDLTVLSYAGKEAGSHYWNCRCCCGTECRVRQSNLQSGHTKSCGCRADPLKTRHFVDGTCIESIRNRKLIASNTSGVRGVYRHRKSGLWIAQITFRGKTKYLGSFQKIEDAARRRRQAEELFDDFLERYDRESSWESLDTEHF